MSVHTTGTFLVPVVKAVSPRDRNHRCEGKFLVGVLCPVAAMHSKTQPLFFYAMVGAQHCLLVLCEPLHVQHNEKSMRPRSALCGAPPPLRTLLLLRPARLKEATSEHFNQSGKHLCDCQPILIFFTLIYFNEIHPNVLNT